jgi:hypothetical protein
MVGYDDTHAKEIRFGRLDSSNTFTCSYSKICSNKTIKLKVNEFNGNNFHFHFLNSTQDPPIFFSICLIVPKQLDSMKKRKKKRVFQNIKFVVHIIIKGKILCLVIEKLLQNIFVEFLNIVFVLFTKKIVRTNNCSKCNYAFKQFLRICCK